MKHTQHVSYRTKGCPIDPSWRKGTDRRLRIEASKYSRECAPFFLHHRLMNAPIDILPAFSIGGSPYAILGSGSLAWDGGQWSTLTREADGYSTFDG